MTMIYSHLKKKKVAFLISGPRKASGHSLVLPDVFLTLVDETSDLKPLLPPNKTATDGDLRDSFSKAIQIPDTIYQKQVALYKDRYAAPTIEVFTADPVGKPTRNEDRGTIQVFGTNPSEPEMDELSKLGSVSFGGSIQIVIEKATGQWFAAKQIDLSRVEPKHMESAKKALRNEKHIWMAVSSRFIMSRELTIDHRNYFLSLHQCLKAGDDTVFICELAKGSLQDELTKQDFFLPLDADEHGDAHPMTDIRKPLYDAANTKAISPDIATTLRHTLTAAYQTSSGENDTYSPQEKIRMLEHLFRGIAILHHNGICHRDVKSDNVFVIGQGIKLGDFGMSIFSASNKDFDERPVFGGTPQYLPSFAFESSEDFSVYAAADSWGGGLIAIELLLRINTRHLFLNRDGDPLGQGPVMARVFRNQIDMQLQTLLTAFDDQAWMPILSEIFRDNPANIPPASEIADRFEALLE
jgi:hypothetical protein